VFRVSRLRNDLDILTIIGSIDKIHSANKQELAMIADQIDSKVATKKRNKDEALKTRSPEASAKKLKKTKSSAQLDL